MTTATKARKVKALPRDAAVTGQDRPVARGQGRPRYRVHLKATTPLAHNPLVVEAATPDEAKAAFCAANNISGSDHEWDFRPVQEGDDVPTDDLVRPEHGGGAGPGSPGE